MLVNEWMYKLVILCSSILSLFLLWYMPEAVKIFLIVKGVIHFYCY